MSADARLPSPLLVLAGATRWALHDAQATRRAEAAPAATPIQFESPSDQGLTGRVTATIQTSCGPIVIELDPTDAPESVNSFVFLSREGFYDGTVFHRLQW